MKKNGVFSGGVAPVSSSF